MRWTRRRCKSKENMHWSENMESQHTTISSAFWGEPPQGSVSRSTPSEKVLARLRWLALGIWGGLVELDPHSTLLPFAHYCLGAGFVYCTFGQYFAYRQYKGRLLNFPIGLTDVALVAVLCALSGGLSSPVYLYFYGLTLIATLRFGWQAGFGMALLSSLTAGLLFALAQPAIFPLAYLNADLGFRCVLLFGIAGLVGLFFEREQPQTIQPETLQVGQKQPSEQPPADPLQTLREAPFTLELNSLLQRVVDETLQLIPCRGIGFVLLQLDTQAYEHTVSAGSFPTLPASTWEQVLAEGGVLHTALDHAPVVLNSPQDLQSRLQSLPDNALAQRHLLVLRLGDSPPLGYFVLIDRNIRDGFRPEDIQLLTEIAQLMAPAVKNAYAFTEASRSSKELRGLLHAVLNAQEEERQRVVSEWHDQLGKKLFRMLQDFRGCQEFVLQHAPEGRERFAKLASEIDSTAALVRQFADDLLPPVLEDFGFVAALREYVAGLQEHEPFEVVMQADKNDPPLSTQTSRKLFRITQEALLNVQKHAEAHHVRIALTFEQSQVSLMIKDDGQGFNRVAFTPGHYGLLYMREQAAACGGRFSVQSEQGRGTEVRVELPLEEDGPPSPAQNEEDTPPAPSVEVSG